MDDCIEVTVEIPLEKTCPNCGKFIQKKFNEALKKDPYRVAPIVLGPFDEVCPICGKIHY